MGAVGKWGGEKLRRARKHKSDLAALAERPLKRAAPCIGTGATGANTGWRVRRAAGGYAEAARIAASCSGVGKRET